MADVWDAYRGELASVEEYIRLNLDSDVPLVHTVASHILSSGGKRIRPLLFLLCARLCGYTKHEQLSLGSLIEYIHTATLLHDDVVDEADLRRGQQTARRLWGNQVSILVGDYLYSKAICQIVGYRTQAINEILAEACRKMAEGELLQLYCNEQPLITETDYLRIVEYKTATLIGAACQLGAIIGSAPSQKEAACHRFGKHLGMAFQLADDTLDYTASSDRLGKALGQDLRQGKITLPLQHLLQHCSEEERTMIRVALETRKIEDSVLLRIIGLMEAYGSVSYAIQRALDFVTAANLDLESFDDCSAKRALAITANYMVNRDR